MIKDISKYKRFISFLSTISIFVFQYSNADALNISYKNNYNYVSNYSEILDNTNEIFIDEKVKNINIDKILSDNIAYTLKYYEIEEEFDSETGNNIVFLNAYLDLPSDVDDDLLIESSIKVSKIITENINKKYIVTYM